MGTKFKIFILFCLFFLALASVLAEDVDTPPTVVFAGDDTLQNGGRDDAYDSLIAIDITTFQGNPDDWELDYSNNGGQSWTVIDNANYFEIAPGRRIYYWSTSLIYAPTLLFRTRTHQNTTWTQYYQNSLSLSHRVTKASNHYFVESFNNSDFKSSATSATWDTDRALIELPYNPPNYHPNGQAYSTNLLASMGSEEVLGVTFQAVQWDFDETIEYQVSNNGSDWYGDTSGLLQPGGQGGIWFSFPGAKVSPSIYVPFNGSDGGGLYWRAKLSTNDASYSPQIYQLRFQWVENSAPLACFTVSPASSQDPEEVFSFNANCSVDYEDVLNNLDFRWDWENNGTFDTAWQTGYAGYIKTHIFNSTSTFTINLEVRDTSDAVASYTNSINEEGVEGAVSGWAWSSNYGWISLNCDNTYYGSELRLCPPGYGWDLNADYTMDGWAWDSNLGWLCLGSTCTAYGVDPVSGNPPTATYSRSTGQVNGWGKFINFDESGWLQLRGNWCGIPDDQCTRLNFSRRSIEGYAWAGGQTAAGVDVGPGWLAFEGSINVPWLETRYGSIYGRGNLGSAETASPPDSRYTASYCILSSGNITNFASEVGCLESAYEDLGFPNVSEKCKTILGVIDFDEILNGQEITYVSADVDANLPTTLAGNVYHFTGQNDYVIDQPITFFNARNLSSSGAGTVVVEGDLYINSNLYFENNPVSGKIENLASIAWLVKGDVIVSPSVGNLVGNFIVLGTESLACPNAGCGNFSTGNDALNPKQLVVNGLVMARQFNLERYYKKAGEPAEAIIYDGRVLINTPPGLADLAKGLPVWREAFATTEIE